MSESRSRRLQAMPSRSRQPRLRCQRHLRNLPPNSKTEMQAGSIAKDLKLELRIKFNVRGGQCRCSQERIGNSFGKIVAQVDGHRLSDFP